MTEAVRTHGDTGAAGAHCVHACSHTLHLYEDVESLAAVVSSFIAKRLENGEGLLLLVTEEHWRAMEAALRGLGIDLAAARAAGQIVVRDARLTLDNVLTHGLPDEAKLGVVVGGALESLARAFPRFWVYGEMVDLLWQAHDPIASIALEAWWNETIEGGRFALFCAYRANLLVAQEDGRTLEAIRHAHTGAVLTGDPERLAVAVDRALEEEIGAERAQSLRPLIESTLHPSGALAAAEQSLLWIRKNLPQASEAILARARRIYGEPP